MLHRAARNAYSWWWASHVRTKQSKWLDQNLQDMEEKVEYILKIIDGDGDTFAQRAEMYYRKRPELVNFVEDSFRGYRALAERYDHLSRELQSANRTIASAFPESVHLSMQDDDFDGENMPASAMPFDELNYLSKNPPAAPEIKLPKHPNFPKKKGKMPSRLMSRKGLVKINAGDAAVAIPASGLSKSEAFQKIDKLQKEILAFQTEKEFVKSSYECGLERFWSIEKLITEMQAEVSNLQDEFGIGTVIEDDEARTLMTATALKSCQEALTRLQEKQEQSAEEARVEILKIQEARERFNSLKERFDSNPAHQKEHLEENKTMRCNMETNKQDQEVDSAEKNIHDVESLRKKIKEELQVNLGSSLTMSELAEKVDELVDNIINLESSVSSQSAHVQRLRSEANEIQVHLQSLEEEKGTLIEGSHSMTCKIKDLEEELHRLQSLNQCIQEENNHLQAHFIEASCNLDDLSEKLQDVKPDEEAENLTVFTEESNVSSVNPVKQIQLHEMTETEHVQEISPGVHIKKVEKQADEPEQNICKVEVLKSPAQTSSSNHHADLLLDREVMATSDANSESKVQEISSCILMDSEGRKVAKEAKRDGIISHSYPMKAESNMDLLSNHWQNQLSSQSGSSLHVNSEKPFGEAKNEIGAGYGSINMTHTELQQEAKKHYLGDSNSSKEAREKSLFQLNPQHNINDFLTAQEKVPEDANPQEWSSQYGSVNASGYHIETLQNVRMEGKAIKDDIPEHKAPSICGKGVSYSIQGDRLHNEPIKSPTKDALTDSSKKWFKEETHVTDPHHNFMREGHMKVESNTDDFVLSYREDHIGGYSLKGQVGDFLDDNVEKSDNNVDVAVHGKEIERKGENLGHSTLDTAAENHSRPSKRENSGDQSIQSVFHNNRGMEEEKNDILHDLSTAKLSSNCGETKQLNALPFNVQVKSISEPSPLEEFIAHEGIKNSNFSTVSRDLEIIQNPKKHSFPDQGKDQGLKQQDLHQTLQRDLDRDQDDLGVEDDDQPNWKELFLSGLDDREKLLLQEYTSILRNYKEARKKLNEVEKRKRASLFQYCIQIKVLKSANASKDEMIQSLEKKLDLLQGNKDGTVKSRERRRRACFPVSDDQTLITDLKTLPDLLSDATSDSIDTTEGSTAKEQPKISFVEEDGGIKVINVDESHNLSVVEERIRTDIDELLEENIGFWMKLSTSFHQIQKFQTTVQDLQAELAKVKDYNKQNGSANHQSLISDIRPIYRHLSEIQTELTLWLDQNAMLKDDLENRLSSLSGIQEEITRMSNAGSRVEEIELSDYQAAKFQGEVLNMKQENNKVADELHLGLEHVKIILVEIERTLKELDAEFGVPTRKQQPRNSTIRSRIPLRTFLFGVKLKKQKPSIFACISPSLQKQYSDLAGI